MGYAQAILVVAVFVGLGVFLEVILHGHQAALSVWALGLSLVALTAIVASVRHWPNSRALIWLTGVELAIISIAAVAVLSIGGAIFPDTAVQKAFGIHSVYSSWPFLMAMAVMTVNLTGAISRRIWPLNYKNLCFTLNHLGLLIIIIGGACSAATHQRLRLIITPGADTSIALSSDDTDYTLPFSVRLEEFILTSFPPTLSLASLDSKSSHGMVLTPAGGFIASGKIVHVAGYQVKVVKYLPRAAMVGDVWHEVKMPTGAPAAFIRVQTRQGRQIAQGWVSSGSIETNGALVKLSNTSAIVMPEPSPRSFESRIVIKDALGAHAARIAVNKPLTYAGYQLYQLSYDEKAGAGSKYSVLEVVRDRGLPVVYTGIFMLLAGVGLLMYNGAGMPVHSGETP